MADKRDLLINLLGRETVSVAAKKAAAGLEDVGDEMDDAARAAGKLDRQIDDLKRSLAALAVQSALTGDVDVTKQIRAQERELRRLTKDRRLIGSMAKLGAEAGEAAGKTTIRTFGEALGALPSEIKGAAIVAGVAIGVASAPGITAAISGAVLAGLGGGAVAAGIAAAIQDPAVKAEGQSLGALLKAELIDAGKAFRGPTLSAIRDIRGQVAGIGDDLEAAFAPAARFVQPLTRGFTGLIKNVIPGLAAGIAAAGPVIAVLEKHLPRIGTAVTDAIESIAEHSDNAAAAFETLLQIIEGTVRVGGAVIAWLTDAYDWVLKIQLAAGLTAQTFLGWVPFVGGTIADFNTATADALATANAAKKASEDGGQGLAEGWLGAASAAGEASEQFETLAEMIDRVTGENISAERAAIRLEEAIDAATESVKENGAGIDINTAKGRANRDALLDIAAAANASAAAILEQTGSTQQASEATTRGRTAFLAAATAMGVEKAEAKRLADMLFGIPGKVITRADLDKAAAERKIKGLLDWIDRIPSSKTITVNVRAGQRSGVGGLGGLPFSHGGRIEGPGPKGVDSVPILGAPGEHVLTAREVTAAGGHRAIERWRKSLTRPAMATPASPGLAASSAPSFTPAQLAAAFRSAITGLSVQLDGRTVGYIQGLQADLYARGG